MAIAGWQHTSNIVFGIFFGWDRKMINLMKILRANRQDKTAADKAAQPLFQLTLEQSKAVAAGNTTPAPASTPITSSTPADKPPVATTTNADSNASTIPAGVGRPPFN